MWRAHEHSRSFTFCILWSGRWLVERCQRLFRLSSLTREGKMRYASNPYRSFHTNIDTHTHLLQGLFSSSVPQFSPEDRAVMSKVLGRPLPDEAEVKRRLAELSVYLLPLIFSCYSMLCLLTYSYPTHVLHASNRTHLGLGNLTPQKLQWRPCAGRGSKCDGWILLCVPAWD